MTAEAKRAFREQVILTITAAAISAIVTVLLMMLTGAYSAGQMTKQLSVNTEAIAKVQDKTEQLQTQVSRHETDLAAMKAGLQEWKKVIEKATDEITKRLDQKEYK